MNFWKLYYIFRGDEELVWVYLKKFLRQKLILNLNKLIFEVFPWNFYYILYAYFFRKFVKTRILKKKIIETSPNLFLESSSKIEYFQNKIIVYIVCIKNICIFSLFLWFFLEIFIKKIFLYKNRIFSKKKET